LDEVAADGAAATSSSRVPAGSATGRKRRTRRAGSAYGCRVRAPWAWIQVSVMMRAPDSATRATCPGNSVVVLSS
jgi:hypothetical protein